MMEVLDVELPRSREVHVLDGESRSRQVCVCVGGGAGGGCSRYLCSYERMSSCPCGCGIVGVKVHYMYVNLCGCVVYSCSWF